MSGSAGPGADLVDLDLTWRQLTGLRSALLEAVTDLSDTGDSAPGAELLMGWLRAALTAGETDFTDVTWADPGSSAQARLGGQGDGRYLLSLSGDLLAAAGAAVDHVNATVLEFEVPMRLRITPAELAELTGELRKATAS